MKKALRLSLFALGLVALLVLVAFADGATMPIDHSVSVAGTVAASPGKVFALITNVAAAPTWRPEVKSVQMLPKANGREAWIEDVGQTMKFLATTTASPSMRVVQLNDSNASYGGNWTYALTPDPAPNTTTITITEDGFIKPILYAAKAPAQNRNLIEEFNMADIKSLRVLRVMVLGATLLIAISVFAGRHETLSDFCAGAALGMLIGFCVYFTQFKAVVLKETPQPSDVQSYSIT